MAMQNESGTAVVSAGGSGNSTETKKVLAFGEGGHYLASGFDSLVLSLSVIWKDDNFFKKLKQLKADSAAQESPMPGIVEAGPHIWIFNVLGYGTEGYAFLLESGEYFVKLIDSMVPKARPSVMIEIRSATLWQTGAIEAVERILMLLAGQGAIIEKARASRVDPCLDMVLPGPIWTVALEEHLIKQADYYCAHKDGRILTGMSIGKGNIQARLYDKPYEIQTKSKKTWMYDVWDLKEVPAGGKIIRVEFQLRREVLVELGIDSVWDLVNHPRNLWAYCTEKWLKFQENAKVHHTQQDPMPWWRTVQDSFLGGQRACPLIRAKTVNANKIQISQQMLGQLASLIALDSNGDITPGGEMNIDEQLSKVKESAALIGMTGTKLYERVRRKVAKYAHDVSKFKTAENERKAKGLPVIRKHQSGKGGAE
jgi:hypothetical protein